MESKAKGQRALREVIRSGGTLPELAARTVLKDDDEFMLELVASVIDSKTSQRQRVEDLCRLLGSYGVGTIVEGRLV